MKKIQNKEKPDESKLPTDLKIEVLKPRRGSVKMCGLKLKERS
jgi:hypothetical protein